MNIIENQLIEAVVYDFIYAEQESAALPPAEPGLLTPIVNIAEKVTKLNDLFKTHLRFKAEAKVVAGSNTKIYVSYKDSSKNPHTNYYELNTTY
jgi:hypothetical protein